MFDAKSKRQIKTKQQKIFVLGTSLASLIASGETGLPNITDSDLFISGDVSGTPSDKKDTITIGSSGGTVDLGAGADDINGGAGLDNLVIIDILDAAGNVIIPKFISEPTANVAENGTNVGIFAVSDASAVGVVSYALSGTDAALFSLNSNTGAVEFVNAPDFEALTGGFNIIVTATDEHKKSTSQNITINVTNVNEAVSFADANVSVSVAENQTAVMTAVATDVDGDSLTYSLSGTNATLFDINSSTGKINFLPPEDYEYPTHLNQQYSVTVEATDGEFSTSCDVEITVTDVGATIDPVAPTLSVPSNQANGTEFTVNTQTLNNQRNNEIAGLKNGGYVVGLGDSGFVMVWQSNKDQDGSGTDTAAIFVVDPNVGNDYGFEISVKDLIIFYTSHTYLLHSIERFQDITPILMLPSPTVSHYLAWLKTNIIFG